MGKAIAALVYLAIILLGIVGFWWIVFHFVSKFW